MAHPDLDELLNVILPFAQQQLEKHGGFFPFGAALGSNGDVKALAGYDGDEAPGPDIVVELLFDGLRSDAASGLIRASGVCLAMTVQLPMQSKKSDAICVRLEHRDGDAVHVFLPYRKGLLGRVKYGELVAEKGDRQVFT